MIRKIPSVACALLMLAGCSTIIDKPTQEMSIVTPGAEDTVCYLERPGFRTRVWTPTTIRMTKSRGPMMVDCFAEGNREKRVLVTPGYAPSYHYNVSNLMLGAAYDYETDAMYQYPEVVVVSFIGVKPSKMPSPAYQKLFAENPDMVGMEQFRPGMAALHSDRTDSIHELQPRGEEDGDSGFGSGGDLSIISGAPGPADTDNRMAGSTATAVTSGTAASAPAAAKAAPSATKPQFQGQGKSIFSDGFAGGTAPPK